MLIRVLDTETTGMKENGGALCEVGWCDVVWDGVRAEVGDPLSMVCNPGVPMPAEARAVHHISDAEIAKAPPPSEAIARAIHNVPILAAHNADFERGFIEAPDVKWICTYKVAVRLFSDLLSHSNQALRYELDLAAPDDPLAMPPHRAGPDAYVTARLLACMLEGGEVDVDTMLRWSSGPALLTRVSFGKHRGERWDSLPPDYLQWIIDKSELDGDAKANARYYLKRSEGGLI